MGRRRRAWSNLRTIAVLPRIALLALGALAVAGPARPASAQGGDAPADREPPRAAWRQDWNWPSVVQIDAPSINSASPDLLDRSSFPQLMGVAWDERFQPGINNRAVTIDLTPLGVARMFDHGGLAGTQGTDLAGETPRVAARVTIGGPLQFVGRGRAARADRATNHITSEFKLALLDDGEQADGASERDRLTLALAADNLATGYGLDRYAATLIAERQGACTWTANAGVRIEEKYRVLERIEEAKLATGVEWRAFASQHNARAVDLGLSGGWLFQTDSNAAWQDGARVDLSVTRALRVSVAARRSVRPELPGQNEARGVLSVAYNLGGHGS